MTNKERAAMQAAWVWMDWYASNNGTLEPVDLNETITALREALAEPQITTPDVCGEVCARAKLCYGCNKDLEEANAKYVEQAEQEPLLWGDDKFAPHERPQNHEPVAWAISHSLGLEFGSKYPMQETKEAAEQMARQHMGAVVVTPLYAAPVRTKDLTDDEIFRIYYSDGKPSLDRYAFARAVITAYKEKNK